jgi:hypothetical protein
MSIWYGTKIKKVWQLKKKIKNLQVHWPFIVTVPPFEQQLHVFGFVVDAEHIWPIKHCFKFESPQPHLSAVSSLWFLLLYSLPVKPVNGLELTGHLGYIQSSALHLHSVLLQQFLQQVGAGIFDVYPEPHWLREIPHLALYVFSALFSLLDINLKVEK